MNNLFFLSFEFLIIYSINKALINVIISEDVNNVLVVKNYKKNFPSVK